MCDSKRPAQCLVLLLLSSFAGTGCESSRSADSLQFESDDDTMTRQFSDGYRFDENIAHKPHHHMRRKTSRHHHHNYRLNFNLIEYDYGALTPLETSAAQPSDERESADGELKLLDNALQDEQDEQAASDLAAREAVLQADERWPNFEEIENLAGISEWKKERWKSYLVMKEKAEKPKSSRTLQFIYRRVPGNVNGSKRNAIIAVSAIAPRVRPRE